MSAKCMFCSSKVCGEYWIYVVADRDGSGLVKVGVSRNVTRRVAQHRKKTGRDIQQHFKAPFRCEFKAMDAEERALEALARHRVHGDWFDLPVSDVIKTVRRAVCG